MSEAPGKVREKGELPKAYLRMDPNLDQTHPDPGAFVRLMCAANRQPRRGRFKDLSLVNALFGPSIVSLFLERGDLQELADGSYWVDGWDVWQEGDLTVSERMRRFRARCRRDRERNAAVSTVTAPALPARTQDSKAARQLTDSPPIPPADAGGATVRSDAGELDPAEARGGEVASSEGELPPPTPATPEEARAWVRARLGETADTQEAETVIRTEDDAFAFAASIGKPAATRDAQRTIRRWIKGRVPPETIRRQIEDDWHRRPVGK